MSRFNYPIDTDQFQIIREQNLIYVDKTKLMYELANKYRYVFLARPRRFGKSLLCNTFKAYFQGQKELFEGLQVMELEKEWKKYPVLHFTMSGLKNVTIPEAKTKLESLLRTYEATYGKDTLDVTPGDRFRTLIHNAAKQSGERVVVILDEYDSPIMRLIYEKEQLDAMRSMLREFYQVLKDEGAYLRFVFITGVTKFSQLSIFSELNNLNQISMDDAYSGICGITQEELDTVLCPCVEEYAESIGISTEEAYTLLKKNYDGYHFSPRGKDVYAPFSLLRALDKKSADHFWFESGTMTALIDHLKHFPTFNPLEFDGVEVQKSAFDAPCENAQTPLPLLYQSGYLTINTYDNDVETFVLHFPNHEVRQGMVEGITHYLLATDELDQQTTIIAMTRAIKKGELSAALSQLRSYIATVPYDIITKKQWMAKKESEAFYKMLIYIIFSLLNSRVDTEVKSILGRADVVIQTSTDVYVLELKVDKSVEDALAQIDDKGYAIPYEADGRKVTKCGVCISSEARNINHWRIVDADGNIIDEQKF